MQAPHCPVVEHHIWWCDKHGEPHTACPHEYPNCPDRMVEWDEVTKEEYEALNA